jgi:hypothetical protein
MKGKGEWGPNLQINKINELIEGLVANSAFTIAKRKRREPQALLTISRRK